MEAAVGDPERAADTHMGVWHAPDGLGPLPSELMARAQSLRERQRDAIMRLDEALAHNRHHANATEELRTAAPASPVYLDTHG